MYPKSEFPSHQSLPEIESLRNVFHYLDLSKEYRRGKDKDGVIKKELDWLFDKLFALVESTKSFIWMYQVVLGKVNEKKETENHKNMIYHLLRGYYLLDQGKRFSDQDKISDVKYQGNVVKWQKGFTGFSVDDFRGERRGKQGKKCTIQSILKCKIVKAVYKRMKFKSTFVDNIKTAIDAIYNDFL